MVFNKENYINDGCYTYPLKLFHISIDGNLKYITPRVPRSAGYHENHTTARCCLSPSINGCLSATAINLIEESKTIHVYEADIKDINLFVPRQSDVYDCKETQEIWSLSKTLLTHIGVIKIPDLPDSEIISYEKRSNKVKPNGYSFLKWKWDIQQSDDKISELYLKAAHDFSEQWFRNTKTWKEIVIDEYKNRNKCIRLWKNV